MNERTKYKIGGLAVGREIGERSVSRLSAKMEMEEGDKKDGRRGRHGAYK
jgi:hypothetical protein